MDIIRENTTSSSSTSTSSTGMKSNQISSIIHIDERFENHIEPQTATIADMFEERFNLQIPDSTKVVMNLLLRSFTADEDGLRNLIYFLRANQEEASDFFSFVEESKDDLNVLLQYGDSLTQMYMCSLFGIIFSWFKIVNDRFLSNNDNNMNFVVNQPVLVSLFRCECGRSIFPAQGCYLDGVCTECNYQFELKDHSRIQYTNYNQLLNQHIFGGSVNAHKFNELQTTRPWLLVCIRIRNREFKTVLKIPPDCYDVRYDDTFDSKREYNRTFVTIHTLNENMIEEPIDEKIEFLMNSFQTKGKNPCLKGSIKKIESSGCLKRILNNLLNRLLIILRRQNRNQTLQEVILQKQERCQLKSVIQGIITCMRNSDYY